MSIFYTKKNITLHRLGALSLTTALHGHKQKDIEQLLPWNFGT